MRRQKHNNIENTETPLDDCRQQPANDSDVSYRHFSATLTVHEVIGSGSFRLRGYVYLKSNTAAVLCKTLQTIDKTRRFSSANYTFCSTLKSAVRQNGFV